MGGTAISALGATDGLEQEIYEAAVIPECWPALLDRLSRDCGSVGAVIFSNTERDQRWVSSPTVHERMERFISEGWATRNTRASNGFSKGLALLPRFLTEADFYDGDEYERDPLYLEYFRPNGLGWSAGTAIALPHGDFLTLSVERAYALGPMPREALAHLDALRPHLARSAMLAARLSFERSRTAVETLSALGLAACAVNDTGKVLVGNREFEMERSLWVTRGGDRIALLDRRADRQLYEALAQIDLEHGVRSIPLCGTETGPAVLHVVPVRRAAHDLFTRASAILVLTKPVNAPTGSTLLLQALFDLTAVEAGIAARIAAGRTAETIAAADGKSLLTVRQQLKSVLGKTGCHRQTDLARLLARLIPPGM